jgi:hypothetical protein
MRLHCTKLNRPLTVDSYILKDVNKYVRAYINHRLISDSEDWATAEGRSFTNNPLKPFVDRLIMFGATKMFALDNATTIFIFPVGYLTDHVSREQLLNLQLSFQPATDDE